MPEQSPREGREQLRPAIKPEHYKPGKTITVKHEGTFVVAQIIEEGKLTHSGNLELRVLIDGNVEKKVVDTPPEIVAFVPEQGKSHVDLGADKDGLHIIVGKEHIRKNGKVEYAVKETNADGQTKDIQGVPQELLLAWKQVADLEKKVEAQMKQVASLADSSVKNLREKQHDIRTRLAEVKRDLGDREYMALVNSQTISKHVDTINELATNVEQTLQEIDDEMKGASQKDTVVSDTKETYGLSEKDAEQVLSLVDTLKKDIAQKLSLIEQDAKAEVLKDIKQKNQEKWNLLFHLREHWSDPDPGNANTDEEKIQYRKDALEFLMVGSLNYNADTLNSASKKEITKLMKPYEDTVKAIDSSKYKLTEADKKEVEAHIDTMKTKNVFHIFENLEKTAKNNQLAQAVYDAVLDTMHNAAQVETDSSLISKSGGTTHYKRSQKGVAHDETPFAHKVVEVMPSVLQKLETFERKEELFDEHVLALGRKIDQQMQKLEAMTIDVSSYKNALEEEKKSLETIASSYQQETVTDGTRDERYQLALGALEFNIEYTIEQAVLAELSYLDKQADIIIAKAEKNTKGVDDLKDTDREALTVPVDKMVELLQSVGNETLAPIMVDIYKHIDVRTVSELSSARTKTAVDMAKAVHPDTIRALQGVFDSVQLDDELRAFGIKNFEQFKTYWKQTLAEQVARVLHEQAKQQVNQQLTQKVQSVRGVFKTMKSMWGQIMGRTALAGASYGGAMWGASALAAAAGATGGGALVAVAAGGALGGAAKKFFGDKIFANNFFQKRNLEKFTQIQEELQQQVVADIIETQYSDESFDKALGGLTQMAATITETLRNLTEQQQFFAPDQTLEQIMQEHPDMTVDTKRVYDQVLAQLETTNPSEKERLQLARALMRLQDNGGNLTQEAIQDTDPNVIKALDTVAKNMSGTGSYKGAAIVGAAMSSLYASKEQLDTLVGSGYGSFVIRGAVGGVFGAVYGYKMGEKSRQFTERSTHRAKIESYLADVSAFALHYQEGQAFDVSAVQQTIDSYKELKRILHGDLHDEEKSALVLKVSGQERNGVETIPDAQFINVIKAMVRRAEEKDIQYLTKDGVLIREETNAKEQLHKAVELLRLRGAEIEKQRDDFWKLVGKWTKKHIYYRTGGALVGGLAGAASSILLGMAADEIRAEMAMKDVSELANDVVSKSQTGATPEQVWDLLTGADDQPVVQEGKNSPESTVSPSPSQPTEKLQEEIQLDPLESSSNAHFGDYTFHEVNGVTEIKEGNLLATVEVQKGGSWLGSMNKLGRAYDNFGMTDREFRMWKMDQLKDMGFKFQDGKWGYPDRIHTGAGFELTVDEQGKPHVRISEESFKEGKAQHLKDMLWKDGKKTPINESALQPDSSTEHKPVVFSSDTRTDLHQTFDLSESQITDLMDKGTIEVGDGYLTLEEDGVVRELGSDGVNTGKELNVMLVPEGNVSGFEDKFATIAVGGDVIVDRPYQILVQEFDFSEDEITELEQAGQIEKNGLLFARRSDGEVVFAADKYHVPQLLTTKVDAPTSMVDNGVEAFWDDSSSNVQREQGESTLVPESNETAVYTDITKFSEARALMQDQAALETRFGERGSQMAKNYYELLQYRNEAYEPMVLSQAVNQELQQLGVDVNAPDVSAAIDQHVQSLGKQQSLEQQQFVQLLMADETQGSSFERRLGRQLFGNDVQTMKQFRGEMKLDLIDDIGGQMREKVVDNIAQDVLQTSGHIDGQVQALSRQAERAGDMLAAQYVEGISNAEMKDIRLIDNYRRFLELRSQQYSENGLRVYLAGKGIDVSTKEGKALLQEALDSVTKPTLIGLQKLTNGVVQHQRASQITTAVLPQLVGLDSGDISDINLRYVGDLPVHPGEESLPIDDQGLAVFRQINQESLERVLGTKIDRLAYDQAKAIVTKE